MSLITTVRLITRGCRSHALSFNFNVINQQICRRNNYFEVTTPLIQKRSLHNNKNETKTDDDIQIIYTGTLAKKMKIVKLFSLATSGVTLAVQPYLIPKLLECNSTTGSVSLLLSLSLFTFATPLLLHFITSRYVIEIQYNKRTKTYIGTTWSIFLRKKKVEFTPKDVELPALTQMFTNCTVKGLPRLIDFTNFNDPHHYAIIMGYDKPMNFRLDVDNSEKNIPLGSETVEVQEKKSARN